jgi:choline dehydrogenase-like flavoprotein
MVAQYIPTLIVIGAALVAYRFLGLDDYFQELIHQKELRDSYEYIIVGAGTSGAVLASRLAEDSDRDILLIEAGGDPTQNPNIDIPLMADSVRGTDFDWQYKTTPQQHACLANINKEAIWHLGKGLGGTSNINYMQYLRGSRYDYDSWASNGATGWGYKDVLPYFIKAEDQQNGEFVRTVFHGFGGRLAVMDVGPTTVNQIIGYCFKEISLKKRDLNGKNQFGWGPTQATIRNGVRWGTYRAYLRRNLNLPNLQVITHATVQKVVFEGKHAKGVVVQVGDKQTFIKASKEVLLAAGTVGTTKLLLQSGVGPRSHLQAVKIPVVADLPVGENLQDQVYADGIEFFTPYPGVTISTAKADSLISSWTYSLFGTGMKASPRFRESTAYIRLRHQPPQIKYPLLALQIVANPQAFDAAPLNVKEETWNAIHAEPPTREGFTIFPVLLHPRSRGTIRLSSNNPEDPPLINPNYLAEEVDVKILAEGYQFARRLINAKTLKDWETVLTNRLLPECARLGNYTPAYIECHIRHITIPAGAPVGTCRMGAAGDPSAVVDPLLRVRGIKGLRVVDASIIPTASTGDTYATQVMIAEKAADLIREKDTVKAIKEYFKHLIESRHKKIMDDEDVAEEPPKESEGGAAKKHH